MRELERWFIAGPWNPKLLLALTVVGVATISFAESTIVPEPPIDPAWNTVTGVTVIGTVIGTLVASLATAIVTIINALKTRDATQGIQKSQDRAIDKLETIDHATNSRMSDLDRKIDLMTARLEGSNAEITRLNEVIAAKQREDSPTGRDAEMERLNQVIAEKQRREK